MRYATDERSRQLYAQFLAGRRRSGPQPPRGAADWQEQIILAEDAQGNITGGMGVFIRRLPLFGCVMYCPQGPVCAPEDADALRQLTEGAELLAWKYDAMALLAEPGEAAVRPAMEDLGWRTGDRAAYIAYRPVKWRLYRLAKRALLALRARRRRTMPAPSRILAENAQNH